MIYELRKTTLIRELRFKATTFLELIMSVNRDKSAIFMALTWGPTWGCELFKRSNPPQLLTLSN